MVSFQCSPLRSLGPGSIRRMAGPFKLMRFAALSYFESIRFLEAELQVGHSGRAKIRASASGVKTPDPRTPYVGTEVPTSNGSAPHQNLQIRAEPASRARQPAVFRTLPSRWHFHGRSSFLRWLRGFFFVPCATHC